MLCPDERPVLYQLEVRDCYLFSAVLTHVARCWLQMLRLGLLHMSKCYAARFSLEKSKNGHLQLKQYSRSEY